MLINTHLERLNNIEYLNAISNIILCSNQQDLKTLKIEPQVKKLTRVWIELDKIVKPEKLIEEANKIEKITFNCNTILTQLNKKIASLEQKEDDNFQALASLVNKYTKNFEKKDFNQEHKTIERLLKDLEKTEYKILINNIGINQIIYALTQQNIELSELIIQNSSNKTVSVINEIHIRRKKVQFEFEHYCALIDAHGVIDGEKAYLPLANNINYEVKVANDQCNNRGQRPKRLG